MAWTAYSANVLTNPGGESGNLTGWTAAGGVPGDWGAYTSAQLANTSSDPHLYGNAPLLRSGSYAFAVDESDTGTDSRIYQDVSLTAYVDAADIDAGKMRVQAGGWAKSLEHEWDLYKIVIQILNAGGTVISTPLDTGYLGPEITSFTNYQIVDSVIPANGRTLRISFYAYEPGGYGSGVGDDFYVYWSEDETAGGTTEEAALTIAADAGASSAAQAATEGAAAIGADAAVSPLSDATAEGAASLGATGAINQAGGALTEQAVTLAALAAISQAGDAAAESLVTLGADTAVSLDGQVAALAGLILGVIGEIAQAGETIAGGAIEVEVSLGADAGVTVTADATGGGALTFAVYPAISSDALAAALADMSLGILGALGLAGEIAAGGVVDVSITLGAGVSIAVSGDAVASGALALGVDAVAVIAADALAGAGLDLDAYVSVVMATDLLITVTPAERVYVIEAENRIFAIDFEDRIFTIESKNRVLAVEA